MLIEKSFAVFLSFIPETNWKIDRKKTKSSFLKRIHLKQTNKSEQNLKQQPHLC